MEIVYLKLINGDEVITQIEDGVMVSPFLVVFTPQGSMMIPFMAMSAHHKMPVIDNKHVVIRAEPSENLLKSYHETINPNEIVQPKKDLLIP